MSTAGFYVTLVSMLTLLRRQLEHKNRGLKALSNLPADFHSLLIVRTKEVIGAVVLHSLTAILSHIKHCKAKRDSLNQHFREGSPARQANKWHSMSFPCKNTLGSILTRVGQACKQPLACGRSSKTASKRAIKGFFIKMSRLLMCNQWVTLHAWVGRLVIWEGESRLGTVWTYFQSWTRDGFRIDQLS